MTMTMGQIVNHLTKGISIPNITVDLLEPGYIDTEVQGIVTAFSASQYVIEQAISLGANFIITHEGIFYSHRGMQDCLLHDPVFLQKSRLIADAGIGIYRFHDAIHRYQPDGVMVGLLQALCWHNYIVKQQPAFAILTIPTMKVKEIAEYIKAKLHIRYVRVAGEVSMPCERVGISVGYRGGGDLAIPLFLNENVDLVIAGEGPEWETPEYVKDAVYQGQSKALIMLGHAESEAPGMKYLADVLSAQFPMLPVHFIEDRPVFQIL
ncbi:transcriptional regulator [Paenibacillus sp. IHB B 3084]|uniref:Nif3-like dinuclear metal center hexameric protein n=1 Tax=Paenibacillus sp. IHB B 3084 TaxID=867076 RepID=UPI000722BECE|nr:Nif3-like dinuclear metal center hexameric protein [Paenibacillus sp. IHB B 3084]ALP36247.1 transcriptional regulator [Paenibacillus sp. IHB B 3084]